MTVKYSALEHFLANNVVYRVGSLTALDPKANSVFKKHIDRTITAPERYWEWLRAEYRKAGKWGLTPVVIAYWVKWHRASIKQDGGESF